MDSGLNYGETDSYVSLNVTVSFSFPPPLHSGHIHDECDNDNSISC